MYNKFIFNHVYSTSFQHECTEEEFASLLEELQNYKATTKLAIFRGTSEDRLYGYTEKLSCFSYRSSTAFTFIKDCVLVLLPPCEVFDISSLNESEQEVLLFLPASPQFDNIFLTRKYYEAENNQIVPVYICGSMPPLLANILKSLGDKPSLLDFLSRIEKFYRYLPENSEAPPSYVESLSVKGKPVTRVVANSPEQGYMMAETLPYTYWGDSMEVIHNCPEVGFYQAEELPYIWVCDEKIVFLNNEKLGFHKAEELSKRPTPPTVEVTSTRVDFVNVLAMIVGMILLLIIGAASTALMMELYTTPDHPKPIETLEDLHS